jgi:flavodoxin
LFEQASPLFLAKTPLFYGSTNGTTERIARMVPSASGGSAVVDLIPVYSASGSDIEQYDNPIPAQPFWVKSRILQGINS